MIVTIKRGDTYPPLRAYLQMANGKAIRLTDATVRLIALDASGATKINRAATIVNDLSGYVEYRWSPSDTNTSGEFKAEFEVTMNDGSKVSVPNDGYFIINIVDELG